MQYYAMQVFTKSEEKYKSLAKKIIQYQNNYDLIIFKKELIIKKGGIEKRTITNMFSGYVFIHIENCDYNLFYQLKQINGHIRFLQSNQNIIPIEKDTEKILDIFLKDGDFVKISKGYKEKDKIVIIKGALKDLQGNILYIDERRKRAKVNLTFYNRKIGVNLGLEIIKHV